MKVAEDDCNIVRIEKIMKQRKLIAIISSIVAVVILVACIILINNNYQAKYDGKIEIEVVDLDGDIIEEKRIKFASGDTLEGLITERFDDVVFEGGMLMDIEGYQTPDDWSTFICVYVDDKMSDVGISDIKFEDGTIISLRITENMYA